MEDSSGNGLFVPNANSHTSTRFSDIPSLDKDMLSMQTAVLSNNDKLLPMQGVFSPLEDTLTNVPSPETAGLLTAEAGTAFHGFVHPANRPIAMAVAKMERSYAQTRSMLQQCPRNVLLAVLLSLVDEHPTVFVEPVRARLEQLLSNRTAGGAAGGPSGGGEGGMLASNASVRSAQSPNSSSMWSASQVMSGVGNTSSTPLYSAPSSCHRKGRGHRNKEDEQELCSIHHCMRVVKHLQMNHTTGLYECVPGFHCLVDSSIQNTTATKSHTNPTNYYANNNNTNNTISATATASHHNRSPIGKETPCSDALTQSTPSHPYSPANPREEEPVHPGYNGVPLKENARDAGSGEHHFGCTPLLKHFSPTVESSSQILLDEQTNEIYPIEEGPALDVNTLTNLLKSVRALESDE